MSFHYPALYICEQCVDRDSSNMRIIILYEPQDDRFYVYCTRKSFINNSYDKNFDFEYSYSSFQLGALAKFILFLVKNNKILIRMNEIIIDEEKFDQSNIDFQFLYNQFIKYNELVSYTYNYYKTYEIKSFLKMLITEH